MHRPAPSPSPGAAEAFTRGWRAFLLRLPLFAVLAGIPAVAATVITALAGVPPVGPAAGAELDAFDRSRLGVFTAMTCLNMVIGFATSAFTTRLALAGLDGDNRRFGPLAGEAVRRVPAFVGWSIVVTVITVAGLAAAILPGLVAVVFFTFVDFAVVDARANPLRVSVAGILEVAGDVIVVLLIGWFALIGLGLVAGGLGRSLPDVVAAFATSLAAGLFFAYLNCSLGVLYRATAAGARSTVGGAGESAR